MRLCINWLFDTVSDNEIPALANRLLPEPFADEELDLQVELVPAYPQACKTKPIMII